MNNDNFSETKRTEMTTVKAYAIVTEGVSGPEPNLCYTSAPEMIGGGAVYQIYKTRRGAEQFLDVPFNDAKYLIVECEVTFCPPDG